MQVIMAIDGDREAVAGACHKIYLVFPNPVLFHAAQVYALPILREKVPYVAIIKPYYMIVAVI